MLDGLANDEVEWYLNKHSEIVPLFEVDVAIVITPYVTYRGKESEEPDYWTSSTTKHARVERSRADKGCVQARSERGKWIGRKHAIGSA